jgi:hypothetical protein
MNLNLKLRKKVNQNKQIMRPIVKKILKIYLYSTSTKGVYKMRIADVQRVSQSLSC